MKIYQTGAVALIAAGGLALAYGGFSYATDTPEAKLGPLSLSVSDRAHVSIPVWAGAGCILLGGLMSFFGRRSAP